MRRGSTGLMTNGIMNHLNFFNIRIRWGIGNPSYSLHSTFSIDPGYGDFRTGIDWPTTNWDGPSSLSPPGQIPFPRTNHYIKISVFNSIDSQLQYPEVLSGVGASETGNSFPKGPSFLLNKDHLMLEANGPERQHGFFPTKKKWKFEDLAF
ncbi:hypothetical protein O181_008368 [Austropuccinia psidii MF-1]|uniref:Uncharacterized protein n=1 Tax=Austropuccinia psidii MF-1 TaxID=1389203 RepID=A0A9Q3GIF9_9BASI|nr:hypothetical protein [Austropuccinia psidii MF-1]